MSEKIGELKHRAIRSEPKSQADADTMNAMFKIFAEATNNAVSATDCLIPIDGSQISQVAPNVFVVLGPRTQTPTGYCMCLHCMDRAVMYLRDAANALEDLTKEAAKHITRELGDGN